jgi:hypothetical protein
MENNVLAFTEVASSQEAQETELLRSFTQFLSDFAQKKPKQYLDDSLVPEGGE